MFIVGWNFSYNQISLTKDSYVFAGLQALLQYSLHHSALQARTSLQVESLSCHWNEFCLCEECDWVKSFSFTMHEFQGRNIYDGCCTLDIQFSKYDDIFFASRVLWFFDVIHSNNILVLWYAACQSCKLMPIMRGPGIRICTTSSVHINIQISSPWNTVLCLLMICFGLWRDYTNPGLPSDLHGSQGNMMVHFVTFVALTFA